MGVLRGRHSTVRRREAMLSALQEDSDEGDMKLCNQTFESSKESKHKIHTCCLLDVVPHSRHECLCGAKEDKENRNK